MQTDMQQPTLLLSNYVFGIDTDNTVTLTGWVSRPIPWGVEWSQDTFKLLKIPAGSTIIQADLNTRDYKNYLSIRVMIQTPQGELWRWESSMHMDFLLKGDKEPSFLFDDDPFVVTEMW